MAVIFVLLGIIFLFISSFLTDDEPFAKSLAFLFGVIMFSFPLSYLIFAEGEEHGAYNQLRGKYDVTYVIDKDSCVVDTIINFN